MAYEMTIVREVEWHHTDMAGIIHFSTFFYFMEAAEHAFFRSLGFSINTTTPERLGWPRVHVECDFRYPLRFEDSVEVRLLVKEKRTRTLTYAFVFRKLNGGAAREVARGSITVACVKRNAAGELAAVPIPEAIAERIEVAPPEAFAA